jgi:hypothetical protein
MFFSGKAPTCKGYHLEIVEMDFDHPLTDEVLDELYRLTRKKCEWREHPWRPDLYVSNTGIVAKNIRGNIIIKEQHVTNNGYLVVSVEDYRTKIDANNDGNGNQLVHRLVAETFIPNPHNLGFVHHRDTNKFNCHVSNLEWCTLSENMIYAYESGSYDTERVRVVETGEVFASASECARAIGGTVSGIHDCKTGRQKQHRGYHFEFFDSSDQRARCKLTKSHEPVIARNIYTGDEAFFDDIHEASDVMGLRRTEVLTSLRYERAINGFVFYYADREDMMLYGNEECKCLSWIQCGL